MSYAVARIDIPTGGDKQAAFRAFREFAAAFAKAHGRRLSAKWYEDDPENVPASEDGGE